MEGLTVWFDEEGDFLEFTSEEKEGFFKDRGDGIFERVDEDGNTIGFAILNVKERDLENIEVPFNVSFERKASA